MDTSGMKMLDVTDHSSWDEVPDEIKINMLTAFISLMGYAVAMKALETSKGEASKTTVKEGIDAISRDMLRVAYESLEEKNHGYEMVSTTKN